MFLISPKRLYIYFLVWANGGSSFLFGQRKPEIPLSFKKGFQRSEGKVLFQESNTENTGNTFHSDCAQRWNMSLHRQCDFCDLNLLPLKTDVWNSTSKLYLKYKKQRKKWLKILTKSDDLNFMKLCFCCCVFVFVLML